MQIKKLLDIERPREKALLLGVDKISNSELLAIIIKSGTKNNSALQIAYEVLKKSSGIGHLHMLSFNDLISIKGLSNVRAIEILATIELSKRISFNNFSMIKVTHPEHIVAYFSQRLQLEKQENFIVVLLDSKGNMVHHKTVFIGSFNFSIVHPREVFRYIVSYSCASFICIHNHPSGCVLPSQSDIEVTDKLHQIAEVLQIKMLDHIIVAKDKFYSFKENKHI